MPATVDILAPSYVGEVRFDLALWPNQEPMRPFVPITVSVSYERAYPQGIALPLVFILQPSGLGGAAGGYIERYYRVVAPDTLTFTVPSPGAYLVSLAEVFHNRWRGALVIDVQGDGLGATIVRTR